MAFHVRATVQAGLETLFLVLLLLCLQAKLLQTAFHMLCISIQCAVYVYTATARMLEFSSLCNRCVFVSAIRVAKLAQKPLNTINIVFSCISEFVFNMMQKLCSFANRVPHYNTFVQAILFCRVSLLKVVCYSFDAVWMLLRFVVGFFSEVLAPFYRKSILLQAYLSARFPKTKTRSVLSRTPYYYQHNFSYGCGRTCRALATVLAFSSVALMTVSVLHLSSAGCIELVLMFSSHVFSFALSCSLFAYSCAALLASACGSGYAASAFVVTHVVSAATDLQKFVGVISNGSVVFNIIVSFFVGLFFGTGLLCLSLMFTLATLCHEFRNTLLAPLRQSVRESFNSVCMLGNTFSGNSLSNSCIKLAVLAVAIGVSTACTFPNLSLILPINPNSIAGLGTTLSNLIACIGTSLSLFSFNSVEISHSVSQYLLVSLTAFGTSFSLLVYSIVAISHSVYQYLFVSFLASMSVFCEVIYAFWLFVVAFSGYQLSNCVSFWKFIVAWQLVSYCAYVFKVKKHNSGLRCYMHHGHGHQANLNDANLQLATGRIPPGYDPSNERRYPYRTWLVDIALWRVATDADAARHGPMVAIRLGGAARDLVRELDANTLSVGRNIVDQAGQVQHQEGLDYLIQLLTRNFAPLAQEVQLSAIHELFVFRKGHSESYDEVITKYELMLHRVEIHGNIQVPIILKAYMLLNALHVPRSVWVTLLAPTVGMLPQDDLQYRAFLVYLRASGHLIDGSQQQNSQARSYYNNEQGPTEQSYWQQDSTEWNQFPIPEYSDASWSAGQIYYDSYEDEEDESSGCSNPESEILLDDVQQLSYEEAGETLYLAYRGAKRRFRSFSRSGPRRKGGKGKGKSWGKHRSFGKSKGKGKPTFYSDGTPVEEESEFAFDVYYGGKGKGKSGSISCNVANVHINYLKKWTQFKNIFINI